MNDRAMLITFACILVAGCPNEDAKGVDEPSSAEPEAVPTLPGSDRDEQGCIRSAGYHWCERTQQCERPWELAKREGFENTAEAFEAWCSGSEGKAEDPQEATTAPENVDDITIFVAKKIITMEPSQPTATAVAVADGRIVAVGSLESLKPWMRDRNVTVNRDFADKVLMPGLIDPHVHPSLPAVLSQFPFVAPDDWSLPNGEFPGATTPEAYKKRLRELVNEYVADEERDAAIPFIAWGYHPLWHGDVHREQLNEMFPDTPVMLWHRSFHELIGNDTSFELLGITESDFEGPEADWEKGHVWENGFKALMPKMAFLLAPDRYSKGMATFIDILHRAGVTTAMDMGVGVFGDPVGETEMIREAFEEGNAPARVVLTPIIVDFLARGVTPQDAVSEVEEWTKGNTPRVMYDDHFKLMMDGAIYSGLSQYEYPGYLDGHQGIWMAPLETTYDWAETFWNAGYQLHAHTNGDKSAAALIDIVRRLQEQKPRSDHRATLEHFAYATEDQLQQMKELGMLVSANPYYQYILADVYADQWLGHDRARNMVPLGAAKRAGVRFGLHSDSPMAPLSPLTLASNAVTRSTINGNKNNPEECISVDDALRAVTIDAAWLMRWEDRIGSIRAGKLADFVVLEADPYKVRPDKLSDIEIWGTVFEGEPRPVL
jgi:predicted amidohydrolase YtcJ